MRFLNKRKVVKSIAYYIGEVSIVIIGIFVAIQLNNYNERLKNKEESNRSLKRISSDLKMEKMLLDRYKEHFKKNGNELKDIVYNKKQDNLDSILYYMEVSFVHYKMNSEYINLKYSGKLNLISNDTLRYNLVNFYEGNYTFYDQIAVQHKRFVDGELRGYISKEFPSDTTYIIPANLVKEKLKDMKFIGLIKDQISSYKEIDKVIKTSIIDSLISKIKKEIN